MDKVLKSHYFYVYAVVAITCITFLAISSFLWHKGLKEEQSRLILESQSEIMIQSQQALMSWTKRVKGVYVRVSKHALPSRYIPDDIASAETADGKKLVYLNSTYIIRLVNEEMMAKFGVYNHLTGLYPLNSVNLPDKWEKEALGKLSKGGKQTSGFSYINKKAKFRTMVPIRSKDSCKKCHKTSEFFAGNLVGGLSSAVNISVGTGKVVNFSGILSFHITVWLLGVILITLGTIHYKSVKIEQYHSFQRLVEAEEKFRLLLDYTCDWEEWIGPDGKIKYSSLACETITGHTQEEFQTIPELLLNIVHPDDADRVGMHIRESLNNIFSDKASVSTIDFKLITKTGKQRWISRSSMQVFNNEGEWIGLRVSSRDVTDKQRLYQQVLKSQKLESLTVMATSIAHSFNNRLTVVINNIKKAIRDIPPGDSDIRKYLSQAELAAWKSAEITDQMLLFVGHSPMHKEFVNIGKMLGELDPVLRAYILDNIVISIIINNEVSVSEVDINRLKQVVIALFTNSVDAIGDFPAGRINIRMGEVFCDQDSFTPPFNNDGLKAGRFCFIDIIDNGCGMSEDTLGKIFDPFFTTRFTGRGLGMASVLGIVRASGGLIKIESEEEEGTRVRILLPKIDLSKNEVAT